MLKRVLKLSTVPAIFFSGMLLSQTAALADNPTTGLLLNGNQGCTGVGGVCISPYDFSTFTSGPLPAVTTNLPQLVLSCDDYFNDINFGNWWQATEITLTSAGFSDGGVPLFPNANYTPGPSDPTILQDYDAAAYLANEILSNQGSSAQGLDSYAMWYLFDSASANNYPGGSAAVIAEANNALEYGGAFVENSGVKITIYTPTAGPYCVAGTCSQTGVPPTQEFIGLSGTVNSFSLSVPEASTASFVGFNFLAVAGVLFFVRRRYRLDA